ncbi:MAG: proteasome accessory factor PafA2 family protein [Planctomycetaceae bacterium]|nr:proteasome accessory factor PafA2 family protein [Planctomycetaceae bacterium]
MFDRLLGLETEYAVRYHGARGADRPTDRELFERLAQELSARLPVAGADEEGCGKRGVFLANGAAVWFESRRPASGVGLIEGSTPECRSPRDLLAHQRALDRLLSEAAADAAPGEFFLVKNCRDSAGRSYGAQENYEAVLATGWRLTLWRCGATAIMAVLALLIVFVVLPLFLTLLLVNLLIFAIIRQVIRLMPGPIHWQQWLSHRSWLTGHGTHPWLPAWVEALLEFGLRVALIPLAGALSALFATTRMARTQDRLLPFLLSRMVWAGAGWIAPDGRFHIAEKATSRNRKYVHLLVDFDRPLFGLGQFLKLCFFGLLQPHLYAQLMSERQRMQIGIGDSNLCEEAEYLRIGATALVIEAIEAGTITTVPQPRRWKRTLHQISGDSALRERIPLRDGRALTAVQIQRWYLNACRRYVHSQPEIPEEAWDILSRWAAVLDDLEDNPRALIGRVDWITKRFLLDEAGSELPDEARKKIDLRYHELSTGGYWKRLEAAGVTHAVLAPEEIERAMRLAPAGTRAADRGRIIREFSSAGTPLVVSWSSVLVGTQRIALPPESRGESAATPSEPVA